MGVLPKARDREGLGVGGVFREPVVYRGNFGIKVRCLFDKGSQNPDDEVEERGDSPLFLVEQGHGDAVAGVGRVDPIHQAVVGEGEEVGLPRTPWPDQENVVFLRTSYRPGNAGQNVFHVIATPDEEGLQGLAIHVSRAIA